MLKPREVGFAHQQNNRRDLRAGFQGALAELARARGLETPFGSLDVARFQGAPPSGVTRTTVGDQHFPLLSERERPRGVEGSPPPPPSRGPLLSGSKAIEIELELDGRESPESDFVGYPIYDQIRARARVELEGTPRVTWLGGEVDRVASDGFVDRTETLSVETLNAELRFRLFEQDENAIDLAFRKVRGERGEGNSSVSATG